MLTNGILYPSQGHIKRLAKLCRRALVARARLGVYVTPEKILKSLNVTNKTEIELVVHQLEEQEEENKKEKDDDNVDPRMRDSQHDSANCHNKELDQYEEEESDEELDEDEYDERDGFLVPDSKSVESEELGPDDYDNGALDVNKIINGPRKRERAKHFVFPKNHKVKDDADDDYEYDIKTNDNDEESLTEEDDEDYDDDDDDDAVDSAATGDVVRHFPKQNATPTPTQRRNTKVYYDDELSSDSYSENMKRKKLEAKKMKKKRKTPDSPNKNVSQVATTNPTPRFGVDGDKMKRKTQMSLDWSFERETYKEKKWPAKCIPIEATVDRASEAIQQNRSKATDNITKIKRKKFKQTKKCNNNEKGGDENDCEGDEN